MTTRKLISRLLRFILSLSSRLVRAVLTVIAFLVSAVLFAWKNEDRREEETSTQPEEIDGDTAKSYGWDTY